MLVTVKAQDEYCINFSLQSIDRSINQSINQSTNQSINQSASQSVSQSVRRHPSACHPPSHRRFLQCSSLPHVFLPKAPQVLAWSLMLKPCARVVSCVFLSCVVLSCFTLKGRYNVLPSHGPSSILLLFLLYGCWPVARLSWLPLHL